MESDDLNSKFYIDMSTARAIQVSITHVALGIGVGSTIEGLLPKYSETSSLQQQLFEVLVQVGLNGAALSSVASFLRNDDPTFGIPFSMALFEAQPELAVRIRSLSAAAKAMVVQSVQQKVALK